MVAKGFSLLEKYPTGDDVERELAINKNLGNDIKSTISEA